MSAPPGGPARNPGRRWILLAWLVLVGLPAGLEFGQGVQIESFLTAALVQQSGLVFMGGTTHVAKYENFVTVDPGANPLLWTMLLPRDAWSGGGFGPSPRACYQLRIQLHRLGADGSVLETHEATEVLDTAAAPGMVWQSIVGVSMTRLMGRRPEEGDYVARLRLHEFDGPHRGSASYSSIRARVTRIEHASVEPPRNHAPQDLAILFRRFVPTPTGQDVVLEVRNVSGEDVTLFRTGPGPGEGPSGDSAPTRVWVQSCARKLPGQNQLYVGWTPIDTAPARGTQTTLPAGSTMEVQGAWDGNRGVCAASIYVEKAGRGRWIASDPFIVENSDPETTGSVLVQWGLGPGSWTPVLGRRIDGWPRDPLTLPGRAPGP